MWEPHFDYHRPEVGEPVMCVCKTALKPQSDKVMGRERGQSANLLGRSTSQRAESEGAEQLKEISV